MSEHKCPVCGRAAAVDRTQDPHAPFCSRRCKTIDLGRWLGEGYRIPVDDEAGGGDGNEGGASNASERGVPPRREG
jgi:endogenous inhibitor of DNA gyrase (YacG/DUF329 family)